MITTGEDLKRARHVLGWSLADCARALLLEPGQAAERRLREMEDGGRPITGPIRVAMQAYVDGWRPAR